MVVTRTIFARVSDRKPDGRVVEVAVYEYETWQIRTITFVEQTHPEAFAFFSQFDDHLSHPERPPAL